MVPIPDRHALSIGMTTIGDQAFFGVYADREALPDADLLAELLDESVGELLELGGRGVLPRLAAVSYGGSHEAVIVGAVRTPVGRHGGQLSAMRPDDLGAHPLRALTERSGVPATRSRTCTSAARTRRARTAATWRVCH